MAETSLTLLNRVQANDDEAWGVFTRLYGPIVFAWVRSSGMQPHDVENVVQDVFGGVLLKLDTYEPGRKVSGAFRSWLWGITRNKLLNHLRSAKRQPVGQGGTNANIALQQLQACAQDPECPDAIPVEHMLLQNAIEILKSEFDPRTWQAFHDSAVKGRPAKEIGDELNMTAKAVRQAKFRVTKKLRALLDSSFPDVVNLYADI